MLSSLSHSLCGFFVCLFLLLSPPVSSSPSLCVRSQTVRQNCYSQVIILFVRLHSAVNPLGIPSRSLLTPRQSGFSCQSQNIAEGEKRPLQTKMKRETDGQETHRNEKSKLFKWKEKLDKDSRGWDFRRWEQSFRGNRGYQAKWVQMRGQGLKLAGCYGNEWGRR